MFVINYHTHIISVSAVSISQERRLPSFRSRFNGGHVTLLEHPSVPLCKLWKIDCFHFCDEVFGFCNYEVQLGILVAFGRIKHLLLPA